MADGVVLVVFLAGLMAFACLGLTVARDPWRPLQIMARLVLTPLRRVGFEPGQFGDPLLTLLLTKQNLAEATQAERDLWEEKTQGVRAIGIVSVVVTVGLCATVIAVGIVMVVRG